MKEKLRQMRFPRLKLSFYTLFLVAMILNLNAKTIRLGIVVGDNHGSEEDPKLHYAEEDAQKVSDLFQELGGIDAENIVLLKSPDPQHVDLAFKQIEAKSKATLPGDEVLFFFYYSGHGTAAALKLGKNQYPLTSLKENIDHIPAKLHIAVLDACQSGAITRVKGAKLVQPFLLEQNFKSNGSIIITSSSADENSQESDKLKGSFFTHYWISALRGAGDVSGDKRVSLLEAYEYAFDHTVVQTQDTRGGSQHPNAQFKLDVQGDVILTDLSDGSGGIVFAKEIQGDLLVANGRAEIMGEFNKESGKESFMALPAGNYRIFQKDGKVTRQANMRIVNQETVPVSRRDLSNSSLFAGLNKGGTQEAEVALPWKVENWPEQYPWEIGLGFYSLEFGNSGGYQQPIYNSLVASLGFRFLSPLDLIFDCTFPLVNHPDSYGISGDEPEYSQRLSLRAGKFMGPNFEALAKVYHRSGARNTDIFKYDPSCLESVPNCSWNWQGTKTSWRFLTGTGTELSLRLWVWSRVSVETSFGFEYNWSKKSVLGIPYRILPTFHF